MDWFLYDRDLRHERVKQRFFKVSVKKTVDTAAQSVQYRIQNPLNYVR